MPWEEQIEEKLDKNLASFLESKLSEIDCTQIQLYESDKLSDLIDRLSSKIRCEVAEFVKARSASIIDEKAEEIRQEAESWVK